MDDERDRIRKASLYFVSAGMTDVVMNAAEKLPEFRLAADDLPSEFGFLYWDAPVGFRSQAGLEVKIVAVSWGPAALAHARTSNGLHTGPGVWLSFWSDPEPAIDVIFEDRVGSPSKSELQKARELIGPLAYEREVLVPFLPEGDEWGEFLEEVEGAGSAVRALLTTWLFMGQTITATTMERPAPRERRYLEMHGASTDPVRYVALRRQVAANDESAAAGERGTRQLKHQFPVSGHWRRQWYPSQDRHRPLWIDPFWKGPEGAPLLHSERVFTLRR
jgi:hypothetical protein